MKDIPIGAIKSFSAMIPSLMAEETLDASTAVSLAMGSGREINKVRRDLLRTARGGHKKASAAASPSMLATMGVGVKIAPKR